MVPTENATWALLRDVLAERYDELRTRLSRWLGSDELARESLNETWLRLHREDSGISTQKGTPDACVSSVDLYAPDGIINAGDAGIRSSGAIYLGALEIRGAENIRADGEIKGVPKQAASVASLNLETKDKMAADAAKDSSQSGAREQASIIIVEVLGYGGGDSGTPSEEEERQRRRRQQEQNQGSYDPHSIFRVVGSGELTAEQKQKLTSEERANLESR